LREANEEKVRENKAIKEDIKKLVEKNREAEITYD